MKAPVKYLFRLGVLVVAVGLFLWLRPTAPSRPANVPAQMAGKANPTASSSPRNFSNMDVLERKAICDKIRKQDLSLILQAWIDAERVEHDRAKHAALSTTLMFAMHDRAPSPKFLAQMRAFINDPANSKL